MKFKTHDRQNVSMKDEMSDVLMLARAMKYRELVVKGNVYNPT